MHYRNIEENRGNFTFQKYLISESEDGCVLSFSATPAVWDTHEVAAAAAPVTHVVVLPGETVSRTIPTTSSAPSTPSARGKISVNWRSRRWKHNIRAGTSLTQIT